MRRSVAGFTLIEILVALFIFAMAMATLSYTLFGSLNLNEGARKQVNSSTQAQDVLESIRNAWAVQSNYDVTCAPGVILPAGYTAKFYNLDKRGGTTTSTGATAYNIGVNPSTTCTAATGATASVGSPLAPPPMRRIEVQSGTLVGGTIQVSNLDTKLVLDVLRPQ